MVQPKYSPQEALQKIKLMMKYDSSKTLNENKIVIKEQTGGVKEQLEKMQTYCFSSGTTIVKLENFTKPERQFAIRRESKKYRGNFRYYFIDGTVSLKEPNSPTLVAEKSGWNKSECEAKVMDGEKKKDEPTRVDVKDVSQVIANAETIINTQRIDEKSCKAAINTYYTFATNSQAYQLDDTEFKKLKNIVVRCVDTWKFKNWFGGDTKTQKNISILKGEKPSTEGDFGDTSKWRIDKN